MPSRQKIAWAQLKVGITAAAAMAILGILIFLITGSKTFFADEVVLYTYLSDSAALTPGANVRLNGIYVGSIENVELTGERDPRRIVKVTMSIQQEMLRQIPADSEAAIAAENVLGSKYINVRKGKSATTVQPGATLNSMDTTDFDDVVATGYSVLSSMQGMLKRIDRIVATVESGEGSIGKLLTDNTLYNNLNGTVEETRKITEAMNSGKGTLGRLLHDEAIYNEARSSLARLDSVIEGLQQGQGTAGKLLKDDALYEELRITSREIRTLVADLNAGKGTAGKLLKSEEFHEQLRATMSRIDTLMDKINSGEGTLGQLVVNPQMYESLNGVSRELHEFMKDFRANPKKFLSIKLSLF
jgi:phospholipid/cholesterol/gamma-HCH transport system substrate-binding protein